MHAEPSSLDMLNVEVKKRGRQDSVELNVQQGQEMIDDSDTPKAVKRPRREVSFGGAQPDHSGHFGFMGRPADTPFPCNSPSPSVLSLQTQDMDGYAPMSEGASPVSCHSHRSGALTPRRALKYRGSPSRSVSSIGSMSRDSPMQRCLTQMGRSPCIDTMDGLPRTQHDTLCRVDLRKATLLRSILTKKGASSPHEMSHEMPSSKTTVETLDNGGPGGKAKIGPPFSECKGSKRLISDAVDAHLGAAFLNLGFSSPAWRKKAASRMTGSRSAPGAGGGRLMTNRGTFADALGGYPQARNT